MSVLGLAVKAAKAAAKKAAPAMLDASKAARLARARALGYDVDNVLYHGTKADFSAFKPSTEAAVFGEGVYLTGNPGYASDYAMKGPAWGSDIPEGANVMPVFAKRNVAQPAGRHAKVVPNPADIRSIFAMFDPAHDGSPDILKARGGHISTLAVKRKAKR